MTLYTRKEFSQLLRRKAQEMSADAPLQQKALDLYKGGHRHNWLHQTTWLGEPTLNLPQDLFALQEIIAARKPDYIVEVGVAWGGSLLFYSTLMEAVGGKGIVGIDIYIPNDLKKRIASFKSLAKRISWINASSTDPATLAKVRVKVARGKGVLVVLDSNHTHQHVLDELRMYSRLVRKGDYLVCCDSILERIPDLYPTKTRPWGPGNNPMTALEVFLKENDRFVVDEALEAKLLLTSNPRGYLRCVRDPEPEPRASLNGRTSARSRKSPAR